jgi:hypothetical protein
MLVLALVAAPRPPKASPRASDSTLYLPSLTTEIAYMTTKNANSSVMKSAYEISQRSWFSPGLSS